MVCYIYHYSYNVLLCHFKFVIQAVFLLFIWWIGLWDGCSMCEWSSSRCWWKSINFHSLPCSRSLLKKSAIDSQIRQTEVSCLVLFFCLVVELPNYTWLFWSFEVPIMNVVQCPSICSVFYVASLGHFYNTYRDIYGILFFVILIKWCYLFWLLLQYGLFFHSQMFIVHSYNHINQGKTNFDSVWNPV